MIMKVYISATLRQFFGRNSEIELQIPKVTVSNILQQLTKQYPDAQKGLFDNGNLRSFIRIFVAGEDWTDVSFHEREIADEQQVLLLPLIAGGAPSESIISDERRKSQSLDGDEIERFSKHLLLRDIGVPGQKRIKAAKVAVVGLGALGSQVIECLAAAGVGTLRIIDFDSVALGNLQNQVLYTLRDLKRPKVASAKDRIRSVNRGIAIEDEKVALEASNALELISGCDLVIDCTDNYKARYMISDACVIAGIPLVFGAIYQYEGLVTVLNYNGGPCLRCLFPEPPAPGLVPTCAENGTISSLPGIVGSIQANEALKLIIGIGEPLSGRLFRIDVLNLKTELLKVARNSTCPVSGDNASVTAVENFDYEDFCGLKQENTEIPVETISPEELARRIADGDPLTIVDVREPHERTILRFSGAVVIPIGQLERRKRELNPEHDTVIICKEGKRSVLAVRTLREAGYLGPLYSLRGGLDSMKDLILSGEGGWI